MVAFVLLPQKVGKEAGGPMDNILSVSDYSLSNQYTNG